MNISTTQSGDGDGLQQLHYPCGLPLTIAIESSTRDASIAMARGGEIIRYVPLDRQNRTAATITVALNELLEEARRSQRPIGFVAVTDGPGSFTGLRIGVTTAKTLAYALNCKIIAVDSLACMAFQLWDTNPSAKQVTASLNAYRGQQFTATWTQEQWALANDVTGDFTTQAEVVQSEDWTRWVDLAAPDHFFAAEPSIAGRWETGRVIPIEPTAREVAVLGDMIAKRDRFVSPINLLPRYLRDSAAEEKLRTV